MVYSPLKMCNGLTLQSWTVAPNMAIDEREYQLPLFFLKCWSISSYNCHFSFEFYTMMSVGVLGEYILYYYYWTFTCLMNSKHSDYILLVVIIVQWHLICSSHIFTLNNWEKHLLGFCSGQIYRGSAQLLSLSRFVSINEFLL